MKTYRGLEMRILNERDGTVASDWGDYDGRTLAKTEAVMLPHYATLSREGPVYHYTMRNGQTGFVQIREKVKP